jgi:arginase
MGEPREPGGRIYHVLGVPLRTGSLYPGSENDAQAYREASLIARLQAASLTARDEGDIQIPSYLPHHSMPPIRNWPGPRIVWELVGERILPCLQEPGHVPLLIGCDCSIVVGTTSALQRVAGGDVHVLYVDGDLDDAAPVPERCQSGAAVAVWLLTHASPFWSGPPLRPSQVTVIGWNDPSRPKPTGLGALSLAEIRRSGPREAARQVLEGVPPKASLLLHFDVDVLRKQDLPAAYFPHTEGLTLVEARALLSVLLQDPRIRIVEVAEYASLRDPDLSSVRILIDLLTHTL